MSAMTPLNDIRRDATFTPTINIYQQEMGESKGRGERGRAGGAVKV